MRAFRVWLREEGFLVEGVEWGADGPVLARRFEFPAHTYWEFANLSKAKDYFIAAFGPDAHVVMASAGELRFELPGLLPVRPSEKGDETAPPPDLVQPETPDAPIRRERKTKAPLKAIT